MKAEKNSIEDFPIMELGRPNRNNRIYTPDNFIIPLSAVFPLYRTGVLGPPIGTIHYVRCKDNVLYADIVMHPPSGPGTYLLSSGEFSIRPQGIGHVENGYIVNYELRDFVMNKTEECA